MQQFWWLQHTRAPHTHPRTPPPTFGWPWTSARPRAVKIFEGYVCVPSLKICTASIKFFGLKFKIWTASTEKFKITSFEFKILTKKFKNVVQKIHLPPLCDALHPFLCTLTTTPNSKALGTPPPPAHHSPASHNYTHQSPRNHTYTHHSPTHLTPRYHNPTPHSPTHHNPKRHDTAKQRVN